MSTRRLGPVVLAAALLAATGCGTSDAKPAQHQVPKVAISGIVKVDSLGDVRYRRGPDDCVALNRLGDTLAPGKKSVVITDPNGKEVALGELEAGIYETVDVDGSTYVSPGVCNFAFDAGEVPKVDGIYTATVPALDAEVHFTAGDPAVIKYAP